MSVMFVFIIFFAFFIELHNNIIDSIQISFSKVIMRLLKQITDLSIVQTNKFSLNVKTLTNHAPETILKSIKTVSKYKFLDCLMPF